MSKEEHNIEQQCDVEYFVGEQCENGDGYEHYSAFMPLDECKIFIDNLRARTGDDYYRIIAVLDY